MKVQALFTENYDEFDAAEDLGIKQPEPEFYWSEMIINPHTIEVAFKNKEGEMNIHFISGMEWTVKYSDELYEVINRTTYK